MYICGLNKTTLLDYPGHVAATVFTGGCNFRCPFCHNGDLVLQPQALPQIPETEVLGFLQKRKGILSGVCITGGEPALQTDLEDFIRKVKQMGLLVKLDTNGSKPGVLEVLLGEKLLDYIAMDIKNSREKYALTAGLGELYTDAIEQSIRLIRGSGVPYEFRTTVVKELHTQADFEAIGEWLEGSRAYYLQAYRDNENVLQRGFSSCGRKEMEQFAAALRQRIKQVEIRGME